MNMDMKRAILLFLSCFIVLNGCSTANVAVQEQSATNESEGIDVESILASSFDDLKKQYGDPVDEDHLAEVIDGELLETTPYYWWDINDYRLELYYDENGKLFLLRLITEPLKEKDSIEFFDEIGLDRPYIPSELYDDSLYEWDGPDWAGLDAWVFTVSNYAGDVNKGATTLTAKLKE